MNVIKTGISRTMTDIDRKKLLAAVEEIKINYTRRYGLGYPEAHVVADAIPTLFAEIERLRQRQP